MIQSRAPSFSLPRRYPCEDDVGAGSHINSCLPRGHDRLLDAELIARNMAGYVNNGIATLRVTDELRLPAFEYGANPRYLWPPMR